MFSDIPIATMFGRVIPMSVGSVPSSWFRDISWTFKEVMLKIDRGIEPLRLFTAALRKARFFSFPSVLGIGPLRLFV